MKTNFFPASGIERLWNIHRVNNSVLPAIDVKAKDLKAWLDPHIVSSLSAREMTLLKESVDNILMQVKRIIHSILTAASGVQGANAVHVVSLSDKATNKSDTVIFVDCLRYDLGLHTVIADAYIFPLTVALVGRLTRPFGKLVDTSRKNHDLVNIPLEPAEIRAWKQFFPVLAERCRTSWEHREECEYRQQGQIPLTQEMEEDPLCSCGRGKDVEAMLKRPLWAPLAPHVTRIAISPLFAVSYLEAVGRDSESKRCFLCRKRAKSLCSACHMVRYCSVECQRKDWKSHKRRCP